MILAATVSSHCFTLRQKIWGIGCRFTVVGLVTVQRCRLMPFGSSGSYAFTDVCNSAPTRNCIHFHTDGDGERD